MLQRVVYNFINKTGFLYYIIILSLKSCKFFKFVSPHFVTLSVTISFCGHNSTHTSHRFSQLTKLYLCLLGEKSRTIIDAYNFHYDYKKSIHTLNFGVHFCTFIYERLLCLQSVLDKLYCFVSDLHFQSQHVANFQHFEVFALNLFLVDVK